ncbi:hypothetical protein SCLCIDRAFT_1217523 [Scleroderma citrinum Foug A]|uniref:Uroporphyrinogen-III synthase n=1 Tax=Scleroderma citrinum Foug A TaxID=1036808 RepID=A0A0C3A4G1_9AGAM|nr:hypothetical protein SCLCIDRAFT_1217523 [Scleroderma citrinum Foug A]
MTTNSKENTTAYCLRAALKMTTRTHTHPTKNVLLLRTPAEGGRLRRRFQYPWLFANLCPCPGDYLLNVADLSSKIAAGPQNQSLSGVIVTSKRGLEAWSNAVKSIASDDPR